MSLEEHRKAIDAIDRKLVRLLNERTGHALAIGAIKLEAGEEIYAPHRERLIFQRLAKLNEGPIPEEAMRAIYREIMSCSLSLEKSLTVAYLGPEATYTHQAAIRRFGSSLRYTPQKTIKDVFDEVQKDRADYGVVPIENSTEGVVTHTLDLFVDSPLKIVAQIVMPIQHCLVRGNRRTKVRRLYSHPQALAQCRVWMQQNLPSVEVIEASSTTRAAEKAAEDKAGAAIAGSLAAERYNLQIVDHNIQDNAANATRFFVLGRKCGPSTKNDRTSLVIGIEDKVGALHEVMGPFRKYRLNMTRIESRPSKRKAWEYLFFIDCDGHYDDKKVANAIEELERISRFVKILGSYPNGD